MSRLEHKFAFPTDRRRAARRPVFVAGSAVTIHGSKSVVVENVSSTGAKIRGRDLPGRGKQILIWMEGLDVLGSVAWTKSDECGVRFDVSLDADALTCLEQEAVGTIFAFN
jgi:hypothetical protein